MKAMELPAVQSIAEDKSQLHTQPRKAAVRRPATLERIRCFIPTGQEIVNPAAIARCFPNGIVIYAAASKTNRSRWVNAFVTITELPVAFLSGFA